MASKFLQKYFKSLTKGSISAKELKSLNKDEDELTAYEKALKKFKSTPKSKSFKGSISDKEFERLKKLLPDEDKYI